MNGFLRTLGKASITIEQCQFRNQSTLGYDTKSTSLLNKVDEFV